MATDAMTYEKTGTDSKLKTKLRTLERTDTLEIISHLLYRHRVGLLSTISVLSVSYLIYEKIKQFFF